MGAEGIRKEAELVGTRIIDNVNMSASQAFNESQAGQDAGEEILNVAAQSVASSAREYAMECRDLSPMCEELKKGNDCTENDDPAMMLVNCPKTCNSCLPTKPSECINKGDEDSCEL